MLCYRDRWYCAVYKNCVKGSTCTRSCTPTIRSTAARLGLDVDLVVGEPDCFEQKKEREELPW